MLENIDEICGNCQFFDPNDCSGHPVGNVEVSGEEGRLIKVTKGFCRAEFGLILGEVNSSLPCRHPKKLFNQDINYQL